ncbi:hypothetical protein [Citrobacter phage CVT22]|uniref:Uncharacterized protein n=1 Tax=Citrobacter phage CVT22 TaxID=1622234 RepID=A0A0R5ZWL1_9CAUD|nr:hypothetical protein APL39_gp83 [Citrobacter phage CVT22]AJT60705.1 hypothetical protein [Citrobacter phage CVT22]
MTKEIKAPVVGFDYANVDAKALNVRILKITKAENIVHAELAAFSREVLAYVLRTKDITPVSMLIGTDDKTGKPRLTRNNQVVAMHFFSEFLPFTTEGKASDGTLTFGKVKGERTLEKCTKAINDFLYNPESNIWTWAKENVQTEKKPVDYAAKIGNAITAAMDEKKGNMSKQEVLTTILRNGIDLNDLLAVAEMLAKGEQVAA